MTTKKENFKLLGATVRFNDEQSVVVGDYHDGRFTYICLSNGDKVFKEALTVIEQPSKEVRELKSRYNLSQNRASIFYLSREIKEQIEEELK